MAGLRAGFGRADITPTVGCRLVGYTERQAAGVHDRLFARALVVEDEGGRWALVSCELCYLNSSTVGEIRAAIAQRLGIAPAHVFVATSHTHSGPHDRAAGAWPRPLAELVADAVEEACERLQPARLGSGYGLLYGYSINRRWLDRPVDPGVAVVRVDDAGGRPLGLVTNFACHAVVLGPDNLQVSADWPGYACARMEGELGPEAVCLFLQGGAGDINPLVQGVRQHLRNGHPVVAIGGISAYYGAADDPERWNIGNRTGGTFAEVAELGEAFANEALYISSRLQTAVPAAPLWSKQVVVQAIAGADEAHAASPSASRTVEPLEQLRDQGFPAEIMVLGLSQALLVGQPGEVFSETAVRLKATLRARGYGVPMLVSYANGWLSYLPEPAAFDEGGYEVSRALDLGSSRYIQERVRAALEPILGARPLTG